MFLEVQNFSKAYKNRHIKNNIGIKKKKIITLKQVKQNRKIKTKRVREKGYAHQL